MTIIPQAFHEAFDHHRAGRLEMAEKLYRQILESDSKNAVANHQLGVIALRVRRPSEAVGWFQQAIESDPGNATYHVHLGIAFRDSGELSAAIDVFQRAAQIDPQLASAHQQLAESYRVLGRMQEALIAYRRIAELQPTCADSQNNVGATLQALGELEAAATAYQRAIELRPNFVDAYNNLGLVMLAMENAKAACDLYYRAVELCPESAGSHCNLANAYRVLGLRERAILHYQEAIRLRPDFSEAYHNLGVVYHECQQHEAAVSSYQRAIALAPESAETLKSLASTYQAQWKVHEAIQAYERALQINPDFAEALDYLIEMRRGTCEWRDLAELSMRLARLIDRAEETGSELRVRPFPNFALFPPITAEQQLRCSRQWAKRIVHKVRSLPKLETIAKLHRLETSKIKIGYLSADFRTHAVAFMIPELFEQHDRTRFTVYAYSTSPDDKSSIRHRIETGVDQFRDIQSLGFYDAARCIADDGIDLLIDLQGYTGNSREEIFALRPAPIQISYIGFPGTMGAEFIDYILADDYVLPLDQQRYFSESIVHLPGCYQVNDSRHQIAAHRPARRDCGLPDDGFVFCSFNTSYKITPEMFDIWMRLLRAVPKSVLWISPQNQMTTANLRKEAALRGVASNRLIFAEPISIAEHLARQSLADLFLDSFPYNGHATTSIALRMGVPAVTLSGKTFASRVAGSLLRAVGLSDWIARDFAEYEAMALRLATNRELLIRVRQHLAENLIDCRLYNGRVFARNVERAYLEMWKIYQNGQPSRSITIRDDQG